MINVSAIDLMELSLSLESRKLEAASKNLANINKTYSSRADSPGEFYLKVKGLPNISNVIRGESRSIEYTIEADKSNVIIKRSLGNVEYSLGLSLETQILDISQAKHSYEASIRLFNNSKEMSRKIMTIGTK
ncbi:hypothetical protein AB4179_13815 [Vibrio lentus]|uniref:hypothetical protein n=1 Tax=Vibrio TaxID=662 RepID=UPI000C85874C|nr:MULTISPECIES: hypothetical protein [Vibrio]PMO21116.1 hypothetical protein BCT15_15200 [Vibrio splendidus]WGS63060.1 hypothetical protein ISX51_23825 [Vibrio lentus]